MMSSPDRGSRVAIKMAMNDVRHVPGLAMRNNGRFLRLT